MAARSLFAAAMALWLWPAAVPAQLVSSGFPVQNPDWEILVTDFGYADLALDRRPGFAGREYLSGEWAAAVFYSGGHNPAGPIWFQPQWFFPDWVSNSNFIVESPMANPSNQTNADGFKIYRSVIKNLDVQVTITYEMLDSVTGIAQGIERKSAGGAGASLTSSRYVFRQTYKITNISGGTLTNLRLFQLLHGLHTSKSIYDDRNYGGPMGAYRYDSAQQGDSYSFDSRSGEIVLHHDTIAFHSQMLPGAWETGYYGKKDVDDHALGKPGIGVHLDVEANALSGLDFFEPPEGGWVSGAQRFDLGTLDAGASVTHDVLFTVQTTGEVKFSGVKIVIHDVQKTKGNLVIDFEETVGGPIGFILHKSTDVSKPFEEWDPLFIPYLILPKPGWRQFQIRVNANEPRAFFLIEPIIQQ